MVAAGAAGYLQKETGRKGLLAAAKGVYQGEIRLPVALVKRVFSEIRDVANTRDAAEAAGLTQREQEILVSFARGMSYADIAAAKGIKTVTARNAIYAIQQKLRGDSMQGMVLWVVRNGLLDDYNLRD